MIKCKCCKIDFEPLKRNGIILSRYCIPCLSVKGNKVIKNEDKKELIDYKEKLQRKVQEIARLIDHGQPCPSKGTTTCKFNGGHVLARGGNSNCKFNLHNIHRQSAQSNLYSNDAKAFFDGLKKEYGEDYMNFIESLKLTPIVKLTNDEYREKYEIACKVANRMKKNLEIYPEKMRILLRNVINSEIGIYDDEFNIYLI